LPKLRPFQREDVDFIKANGLRVLNASAPGVGKTIVAIKAIAEMHRSSLPGLIVCPASVVYHWDREFKKWAPGINLHIIKGERDPIPKKSRATVYIISWALLFTRRNSLAKLQLKTIVGDESHYVKSPDAQRSKAFAELAEKCLYIQLLTGTPLINSPRELATLKYLLRKEDPAMIRRLLEDVAPDVPEKKRAYLYVQLRPKMRREYESAVNDFEAWLRIEKEKLLGDGMAEWEVERAMSAEALTKIGYLRRLVGEGKVPAAVDWISQSVRIGEPIVVFAEHQAVISKLSKALKKQRIKHCILDGAVSSKKRQAMIDAFQKNKVPVFLGSKAAKEGITLTAARNLLFVERYFTSAEEEQAEDRVRRIGQRHPTKIWFLHVPDTIDDRVDEIVKHKRRIIRRAIRSAAIAESPQDNVFEIIKAWGSHTRPEVQLTDLGLGDPLPPLPAAKKVHGIVFSGRRWTRKMALIWCHMNGYNPHKRVDMRGRFKFIQHHAMLFKKETFSSTKVCADIKIIVGDRVSRANERKIRSAMQRLK